MFNLHKEMHGYVPCTKILAPSAQNVYEKTCKWQGSVG